MDGAMEVHHKQASLPKLRITEESNRRDSLSSSRTGDSGYNSDPDISLSPLDFVSTENPISQKTKGFSAILFKGLKDGQGAIPSRKVNITSNPGHHPAPQSCEDKLDWTKAFKGPVRDSVLDALKDSDPKSAVSSRNDEVEQWIKENLPSQERPKERVLSIGSISSTGSGDMYTITDDSDDERDVELDVHPTTLSKATLKTIELIMRKVELNLGYMAYVQCASGGTSRGQGASTGASRSSRGSSQHSGGKRKSRSDDNLPRDDLDGDGSNKRRRVSITTTTEDSESGPRFACPFYKHDPNRYRSRRTCPGPGWPTVHRMKEHLYRSHAQPIFCPRCYAIFDSDSDFSTHLRSNPCQISVPQPIEGIDRETLNRLRKRSPALRLEEDKWRDTYQLLFPDVADSDIPSPYYDSDTPSEESRRFRRELLERIRQELFATAEQAAGPVEQTLLRQVADIIRQCETDLLASFNPTSTNLLHTSRLPTIHSPAPTAAPRSAPPHTSTFTPLPSSHNNTNNSTPNTHQGPERLPENNDISLTNTLSPTQYASLLWDDSFYTTTSDWIDWNAVFPPGPPPPEAQSIPSHNELIPALSTPV